jgi:hypothetical protein
MTDQKTADEIAKEILAKSKKKDSEKRIKIARFIFLFMAFFQSLSVYVAMNALNLPISNFYIDIFLLLMFLGLFGLSFKHPFISFVIGLCAFVALHLFIALIVPNSLMQGFVYKIIIMTALVLGMAYSWNLRGKGKTNISEDELLDNDLG